MFCEILFINMLFKRKEDFVNIFQSGVKYIQNRGGINNKKNIYYWCRKEKRKEKEKGNKKEKEKRREKGTKQRKKAKRNLAFHQSYKQMSP